MVMNMVIGMGMVMVFVFRAEESEEESESEDDIQVLISSSAVQATGAPQRLAPNKYVRGQSEETDTHAQTQEATAAMTDTQTPSQTQEVEEDDEEGLLRSFINIIYAITDTNSIIIAFAISIFITISKPNSKTITIIIPDIVAIAITFPDAAIANKAVSVGDLIPPIPRDASGNAVPLPSVYDVDIDALEEKPWR